jgi:hypothetical protein
MDTNIIPESKVTAPGPVLLLRLVQSGDGWSWRLFSRERPSSGPRLLLADSRRYRTEQEAREAGRATLNAALSGYERLEPIAA